MKSYLTDKTIATVGTYDKKILDLSKWQSISPRVSLSTVLKDMVDEVKTPISQNEQQEEVAEIKQVHPYGGTIIFNENYKELPIGTKLYASPPKQAIPEGWISTKDRLPDQLELKIKLIDGSEIYAWYQSDGDYYWNCGGCEIFIDESKVTHWMPLPAAPTNTEVGE